MSWSLQLFFHKVVKRGLLLRNTLDSILLSLSNKESYKAMRVSASIMNLQQWIFPWKDAV